MAKWKKGETGNPNGRPRQPEVELLRQAIATVEKKKKKKLWTHMVERAYVNDNVLTAIAKKYVPDLSSIEAELNLGSETLATIQAQQQAIIETIKTAAKKSLKKQ